MKHHADLLTLLPDDLKEPLRSVLREELTEYAARERGRLHRSWRRLDGRRAALALAALLLSAFTAIAWGLDPSSAPLDYAFPASAPLIIAVALVRQGLWRPLPQDFDPKGPDGD